MATKSKAAEKAFDTEGEAIMAALDREMKKDNPRYGAAVRDQIKSAKAPTARAQKKAFAQALADMNETAFCEITNTADGLLVSKGGKKSSIELFDRFVSVCETYPIDVAAHASLLFAGNAYAGYRAFLELNRSK